MRCPKCGNESQIEEYLCSNCQYHLKTEKIEKFPLFRRREDKWYKPDKAYKRIFNVITNPAKAFWDINHKKDGNGPLLIKILCGLGIGLWALAVHQHMTISRYSGYSLTYETYWVALVQGLPVFLVFFLFGFLYYTLLFWFCNFLFSLAANITVQLDDILRIRYNVHTTKSNLMDLLSGKALRKSLVPETTQSLVDTMKKKDFLTKIEQTGKFKLMNHAYAPFILINLIGYLILIVSLPTKTVSDTNSYHNYDSLNSLMASIFSSPAWAILDVLQIIKIAVWFFFTLSVAHREIGNTNTLKILIGNFIVGVLLAYMIFFLRPTLGWNLNIIATYGG